ncbi:MAG: PolC-type DNA polymerase III, partial [Parasporobacterium sp.]|nr:PolC-type DNA polymerase III [Parasporobacterium sp.]
NRLDKELNSIISNGYSVMYIIARELVIKSVSDGYLVGSRGSVGSSFVATMSGITEVNPLPPHYRCLKCRYSDFDSPEVKAFGGGSGCDMPDRTCPVCGEPLYKDGYDIPFETFLGFKGDKEPDIDLNFSGEYQSKAHDYTEVIFGKGHTFRAGTIATLQDKTIYGYVKGYMEHRSRNARKCEMNRLVQGLVGTKRSTGQHPGGIVVLPHGEEIYSFTPVQHPANDVNTNIVTTHFEYHSIDHNLLKLDILGHDDPTMIKMLEDLTGTDAKQIKMDDPTVMKLFESTEILGITPEDICGYKTGTLGIPEFGTDFTIGMLLDTKPKNFSDLVRIAGLSHGTDVWLSNAETLIKEGKATLSSCICTRDDIMIYLIQKGVDPALSFNIMESVRKGKVAKGKEKKWPEWEKELKEHDVPDWYLWSCTKIQYMFPKAHAVAYVMMAYRIAYYKIFYPLAYYAAYFSIRASAFDYELMCLGKENLVRNMDAIKARISAKEASPKDEQLLKYMNVVLEMYSRGFEFLPIDIYRARASRFQVIDGKLMPSFESIDGMGDKAAVMLEEAAKGGKFMSREEFRTRSKVSSTLTDKMYNLGILGDMPESSQMSITDYFKF